MSSPAANRTRLFISYAHADSDWARQLRERLRQNGLATWPEEDDLTAGADWGESVRAAMEQSSHVVFLVTRGAAKSPYLLFELGMALAGKKGIIPVVAEDVLLDDVPGPMRSRQVLRKRDPEEVAREIADVVG
jgi:hypothetical protein